MRKAPPYRYFTVEFRFGEAPHAFRPSGYFPGFYVGGWSALKRRIRDRLSRIEAERKTQIVGGGTPLYYRINRHTKQSSGVVRTTIGTEFTI